MNKRIFKKSIGVPIFTHLILFSFSVLMLIPLIWMISTAFKAKTELFSQIPIWIPNKMMFSNFSEAWQAISFGQLFANTIMITSGLLVVQLVTSALAAYAFARMEFKGKNFLFFLFLAHLMINPQCKVLPNYLTISKLGLLDTKFAVMAPYFASAVAMFLLRQAFKSIPKELEEAARLDGCGGLRFLWSIAIPLVRPVFLAFSIISLSYHWNEFFWPLMVTDTSRARTLTVGLGVLAQSTEGAGEWNLLMAATIIVILPLLCVFLLFQRKFVSSFMQSGFKG